MFRVERWTFDEIAHRTRRGCGAIHALATRRAAFDTLALLVGVENHITTLRFLIKQTPGGAHKPTQLRAIRVMKCEVSSHRPVAVVHDSPCGTDTIAKTVLRAENVP